LPPTRSAPILGSLLLFLSRLCWTVRGQDLKGRGDYSREKAGVVGKLEASSRVRGIAWRLRIVSASCCNKVLCPRTQTGPGADRGFLIVPKAYNPAVMHCYLIALCKTPGCPGKAYLSHGERPDGTTFIDYPDEWFPVLLTCILCRQKYDYSVKDIKIETLQRPTHPSRLGPIFPDLPPPHSAIIN